MPEPAFLVEGSMEKRIIQKICHGKTVRLIGCNGDNASMLSVSRAIDAHLRLLKKRHSPVIILLDRERRAETCKSLKIELSSYLDQCGHEKLYKIGFADRTIENWILADWDHVRSEGDAWKALDRDAEGCHGKSVIKQLMPRAVIYHETTLGVELFLKCRPEEIFERSESFRDFVADLQIDCFWLNRLRSKTSNSILFSPPSTGK